MLRIRQQLKIQPFLRAEFLMRIRAVHAHPQNHRVLRLILRQIPLEVMRLGRASTGKILRIEIQHHPFPPIFIQTHRLPLLRIQSKIRRHRPHRRRPARRAHHPISPARQHQPLQGQHNHHNHPCAPYFLRLHSSAPSRATPVCSHRHPPNQTHPTPPNLPPPPLPKTPTPKSKPTPPPLTSRRPPADKPYIQVPPAR